MECSSWKEDPPLKIWFDPEKRHVFCHVTGEEIILPVSTEEGNEMSRSNKKEVEQVVKMFIFVFNVEYIKFSNSWTFFTKFDQLMIKSINNLWRVRVVFDFPPFSGIHFSMCNIEINR